jgi:single-strand DNA-binding protein
MAKGVNKVILLGYLGADPEMKYTASGTPLCTFRMATSETFNDRDGNQQERTEWHRVVAWNKLGENCGKYLSKGRQVYIEGKITTRNWDDQDGTKHYMTEINARDVQFLGGGNGNGGQQTGGQAGGYDGGTGYGGGQGGYGGPPPAGDDDIPF